MPNIGNAADNVRRISPQDGAHYFFGYYDLPAFSSDGMRHLCHRTTFRDRLPNMGDVCEVGYLDTGSAAFHAFGTTQAFNFQQGAMLQWYPANGSESVAYNVRGADGYQTCIHNLGTGARRVLPAAAANISADGKHGLCINMQRVFDFRPGYGYAGAGDPYFDVPQPLDDGIFLMDMHTGQLALILHYRELAAFFGIPENRKVVVNHITFNPSGTRFLFLLRTFAEGGSWSTCLGTAKYDGSELYLLSPPSMASHYHWRDDAHLLIWAEISSVPGMYLLRDQSTDVTRLNPDFFTRDIHCVYSPDRRFILGDGYPDHTGHRAIELYDVTRDTGRQVCSVYSMTPATVDVRCDLHNRWSRDGRRISFDSTHEGFHGVYVTAFEE